MGDDNFAAWDAASVIRRAAEGDHSAWERLVQQYARLIWAITRDFQLVDSDAADVSQVTWLRLLENIDRIERPAHLGSWLATTAKRECLRTVAARQKVTPIDDVDALSLVAANETDIDEHLVADEDARAIRGALATLPERSQRLMELLMADPPVPYSEISGQLGVPIGSIGPTRARCLTKLRAQLEASWLEAS